MPINLEERYRKFCEKFKLPFQLDNHVRPYDDSTLFCPAGMQQFKKRFSDQEIKGETICNIQSCLRLNDYEEIGDGTHLLYFNMMGLFSFRHLSVKEAIDFWVSFIQDDLGLKLDYVTIHPDRFAQWSEYYSEYGLEIRLDPECTWSDGTNQPSYCTEFYIDDIEIGNIVNPNGDCIDVGFGYERLESILNRNDPEYQEKQAVRLNNKKVICRETIQKIVDSGYRPGPVKQGYILRKLLRDYVAMEGECDPSLEKLVEEEIKRQEKVKTRYLRLRKKHLDKPEEWWYETHGIDAEVMKLVENELKELEKN